MEILLIAGCIIVLLSAVIAITIFYFIPENSPWCIDKRDYSSDSSDTEAEEDHGQHNQLFHKL
jgi:hypothetical protein